MSEGCIELCGVCIYFAPEQRLFCGCDHKSTGVAGAREVFFHGLIASLFTIVVGDVEDQVGGSNQLVWLRHDVKEAKRPLLGC